jgi:hypothetical protein
LLQINNLNNLEILIMITGRARRSHRPAVCALGTVALALILCGTASASPSSVTAGPASATVFGGSSASMSFPLERAGDLSHDTWVHYKSRDGSAVAGSDYEAASGSVLMSAGATEVSIPVQALGASAYSPDKQFTLELEAAGVGPMPTFMGPQDFAGGDEPNSVAAPDLNGDGRPDLITANGGDDTFSVMLNATTPGASAPSYTAQQVFAAGRGPRSAESADVNGDGKRDLILINNTIDEDAVSVFLNTTIPGSPTASFGARQIVAEGDAPFRITVADLNGDGRSDLIVSQLSQASVSVMLNITATGASTVGFTPQKDFTTGASPNSVKATDLNGDGRRDLIVVAGADKSVSVLLNTTAPGASTPSFAARRNFPALGLGPRSVATADINADGRPDLVVAGQGTPWASVLLNTTAPGATTPSFAAPQVVPSLPCCFKESVTAADLNGDGRHDLVVVGWPGSIASVLLNTTPPGAETVSFSAPLNLDIDFLPEWVTTTDVNGDGTRDLLVAIDNDKVSVLLNTTAPGATTPSFAARQPFATGDAPGAIGATDVNGDGRADLLTADAGDDTASVLLNTTAPGATTPSFAARQPFATGDAPGAIGATDVNGDGGPDVVVPGGGADDVSVLLDTQYAVSVSPTSVTGTIHYQIPEVSLGPGTLVFGEQLLGSSTNEAAILSNEGGDELTIEGIEIGGPDADAFSQTNSCPSNLAPGSDCPIAVTYTPDAAGAASATLTVTSDAPSSPDTVALSGTGHASSSPPGPSPPDPGSDTTVTARFEKTAPTLPRLRINRVRSRAARVKVEVAVIGTIVEKARGVVRIEVSTRLRGERVIASKQVRITHGRWRARLVFAWVRLHPNSALQVTARFGGSPGVRSGHARRSIGHKP